MNPLNEKIEGLLEAYLTDTITPEDMTALNGWVSACAENAQLFERIREVWFSLSAANRNLVFDSRKGYERFIKRVRKAERRTLYQRLRPVARYAAAVVVAVVLVVGAYVSGRRDVEVHFAEITTEAPMGSTAEVVLPDGSLVVLNAGSRIVYSQSFGMDNRNVALHGEGYFEVKRNESVPFVVTSEQMTVRVLGTKFNLCDYKENQEAAVTLVEGKVDVTNNHDQIHVEITPDTRAIINKESHAMVVEKTSAADNTQWREGYLFFDEEPLADIARELERCYGVNICIERKELNGYKFYGKLPSRQLSIEEVLDILSSAGQIDYSIEGRHITLN